MLETTFAEKQQGAEPDKVHRRENRAWPEAATPHTVMMLYWRVAVELGSEKLLRQLHKTKPRSSQWHQDAPLQLATILVS